MSATSVNMILFVRLRLKYQNNDSRNSMHWFIRANLVFVK